MCEFFLHYLLGFNLITSKYQNIKNKIKILAKLRKSKIRVHFLLKTTIIYFVLRKNL